MKISTLDRAIEELARAYPEFEFREFPETKNAWLRVQAGTRLIEAVAAAPDKATGFLGFSGYVERFHLKAYASTPGALAEILSNGKNGTTSSK